MRSGFSSRMGFIIAAAGSAVGLGNVWKFPFEVANGGGGVFVFIYIIFCAILGLPLIMTEIAIGRRNHLSGIAAFTSLGHKKWSFIPILSMVIVVLIYSFYNVVSGWTILYSVEIAKGNFEAGKNFGSFASNFKISGWYSILSMLITVFIVIKGVSSGIERYTKLLMPALFFLIFALVIYSITLPGASEGLKFYLVPDLSKVTLKTIYSAMGQAFFSLSVGMGITVAYGSYLQSNANVAFMSIMVILADLSVALLSGLMVFSITYSQGLQDTAGGAGLIFTVLPGLFANFGDIGGRIIGLAFFLLLFFAALTSTVALLESLVASVVDKYKMSRKKATYVCSFIVLAIGFLSVGANGASDTLTHFVKYSYSDHYISFMDFIGNLASDTLVPISALLIVIYAIFAWKMPNLIKELSKGFPNFVSNSLGKFVIFALKYICPVLISCVIVITILQIFFGIDILK